MGHADDAELLMYIIVPGFISRRSKFKMTYKIICPSNNCRLRVQTVSKDNFKASKDFNVFNILYQDIFIFQFLG